LGIAHAQREIKWGQSSIRKGLETISKAAYAFLASSKHSKKAERGPGGSQQRRGGPERGSTLRVGVRTRKGENFAMADNSGE